jgi:hypothetical protein
MYRWDQSVSPRPKRLPLFGGPLKCKELAFHYLVHVPVARKVVC